jgi:hypothetical protein
MYFPYLRGRQFELLALRELLEEGLIGNKIIPIIEPIKLSSTLVKTLELYINKKREIALIHNPQVGNFSNDVAQLKDNPTKESYMNCFDDRLVIKSHIYNKKSKEELKELLSKGINKQDLLLINCNRDFIDENIEGFSDIPPQYNLIPDESVFRRKIKKNRVLLDDKFEKQSRNVDYKNLDDEFFSDDHLFYHDDGFVGFSDYSIIGSEFSESGFAPFAVAIHIVYFDDNGNLRIKHFVSDSNDDINDPANKFYEAMIKLKKWQDKRGLDTFGMEKFMEHYENGTYPGLGTVKKLSLMHHIELVSKYLDEVQ